MNRLYRTILPFLLACGVLLLAAIPAFAQTAPPSSMLSDDFNKCSLNSRWDFVDPLGDSSLAMSGEEAQITIPAGSPHDAWTAGNNAPRIMMPVQDEDFEIEVKFETPVTKRFQAQGFIIEEDETNYIRVDVQSDGTDTRLKVATIFNDSPFEEVNQIVAQGAAVNKAPIYLRVLRNKANISYQVSYSFDGTTWQGGPNFEFFSQLEVIRLGIFAANSGGANSPAFTSRIDYFFNNAARISPEDPNKLQVLVNAVGGGTVTKDPECGSPVTLTAVADDGWSFESWSGGLSGSTNPAVHNINDGDIVTATFVPDPWTLNLFVSGGGSVGKSPDQDFYATNDTVEITATAASGWVFDGWFGDIVSDVPTQTVTLTDHITATARFQPTAPSGIDSDDFNECTLDPERWTFVNPQGDGSMEVNGNQIILTVPGGATHDLWKDSKDALRVMQPADDVDFGLEMKFESPVTKQFQMQGFVIEQDDNNFIRINVQNNGGITKIFGGAVIGESATNRVNYDLPNGAASGDAPFWLQVYRAGRQWSIAYSTDGVNFITNADLQMQQGLTVTKVGIFAGNAARGSKTPPGHTAIIDYFFTSDAPISPEDGKTNFLPVQIQGKGTISKNPPCGTPVTVTATPAEGWTFQQWGGAGSGTEPEITVDIQSGQILTAVFREINPNFILASDDFNACTLDDEKWSYIDPLGDSEMRLANQQQLLITVPEGTAHTITPAANNAPRVMQVANDANFEVTAKFESEVRRRTQIQGLLWQEDDDTLVHVNVQSGGSKTKLQAISINGAEETVHHNIIISDSLASHVRVQRVRPVWTVQHSGDGVTWSDAISFTMPMTVTGAGVYAGNDGELPPTHTMSVDYIFNALAPIEPEDSKANGVNAFTDGSGTVLVDPSRKVYDCGEEVTVTAVPANGWHFSGWSGGLSGNDNPAKLSLNRSTDVTATFDLAAYSLVIDTMGEGTVEIDPVKTEYLFNEAITLTVRPDKGWLFAGWSGDLEGTKVRKKLVIKGDTHAIAVFGEKPTGELTLLTDVIGNGTIDVRPLRVGYAPGDVVSLEAKPSPGNRFVRWTGAINSDVPTQTLTMQSSAVVTATFAPEDSGVQLTVNLSGSGVYTTSPEGPYTLGTTVLITATPNEGWLFSGWSINQSVEDGGTLFATAPSISVKLEGDLLYFANFRKESEPQPVGGRAFLPFVSR